jgi:hypothetical protein
MTFDNDEHVAGDVVHVVNDLAALIAPLAGGIKELGDLAFCGVGKDRESVDGLKVFIRYEL